jgi:hypothetical protein
MSGNGENSNEINRHYADHLVSVADHSTVSNLKLRRAPDREALTTTFFGRRRTTPRLM